MAEDKKKSEREQKIAREIARLTKNFSKIDGKKRSIIRGLIDRAAFMRVSLDEMEEDLDENGFTELFSQGDQVPYERKRPTADLYNTMNANYQKIIKQLTDLAPKEETRQDAGDGFDEFVEGREDA